MKNYYLYLLTHGGRSVPSLPGQTSDADTGCHARPADGEDVAVAVALAGLTLAMIRLFLGDGSEDCRKVNYTPAAMMRRTVEVWHRKG